MPSPVAFVLKGYPRLSEAFIAEEIHGLEARGLDIRIVSLRHPTASAEEVQDRLAAEHGIITSSRGGGIRVSLHAYNSADDVRTLSEALESTNRRRPRRPR